MGHNFELSEYRREAEIYEKHQLLVPLADGMLAPPHPMVEGMSDDDYYKGEVTGPTQRQIDWVRERRPEDSSLQSAQQAVAQPVEQEAAR